jgi:ATPase subunit of ABC transporter with duplicated ATPase domains
VNRGDRIHLVGPNGADKSTLFSLILNDVSLDSGKIFLERNATLHWGSPPAREIRQPSMLFELSVSPAWRTRQEAVLSGLDAPGSMF